MPALLARLNDAAAWRYIELFMNTSVTRTLEHDLIDLARKFLPDVALV